MIMKSGIREIDKSPQRNLKLILFLILILSPLSAPEDLNLKLKMFLQFYYTFHDLYLLHISI